MKKLLLVVGLAVCIVGVAKAELFVNPGFEDDLSNWDNWGSGSNRTGASTSVAVMEDGTAHSGDKYAENSWDFNAVPAPTSGYNLLFQNPLVTPGDTYTLSAWVRDGLADPQNPGAGTIPARLTFEQRWWDGVSAGRGDEVDVNGNGDTGDDRVHFDFDVPSDGQWHLISATHTAPLTVNQFTAIVVIMEVGSILDMDDVSLLPYNAYNPNPPDDGDPVPITLDTLEWENSDPNGPGGGTIVCQVYYTSDYPEAGKYEGDPNFTDYAQPISVNEDQVSAAIPDPLGIGQSYYWRVDCTNLNTAETVIGHVWTFRTDNGAPKVNAGDDVHTWPGAVENLDATVSDDGFPEPAELTISWAVTAGDAGNVQIAPLADPQDPDTEVTITATGTYELTLTAHDGNLGTSDTVTIVVHDDACSAAKAALVPLLAGDINQDCTVDLGDLRLLAEDWLMCIGLGCL